MLQGKADWERARSAQKLRPPFCAEQVKETARQYMQVIDFQAQKHFEALMRVNGL